MWIVVVTGVSGSGKTTALRSLEDVGFYAIDNLPVMLIDKLVELSLTGETSKLALVVDAREPAGLEQLPDALAATRDEGHVAELLFLDASDEVLARRFSETRRPQPLSTDGSVQDGIERERGTQAVDFLIECEISAVADVLMAYDQVGQADQADHPPMLELWQGVIR